MLNLAEFTNDLLFSLFSLLLIHRSQSSPNHIRHLGHKPLINLSQISITLHSNPPEKQFKINKYINNTRLFDYPKEVVGVIATETNELENVVNGDGCDIWVEPKFDIAILCLHKFKHKNFESPFNGYAINY